MKKTLATILCFLTLGVFLMIYVQARTHLFKFEKLNGVFYQMRETKLTFNSFKNGQFQKNLEYNLRFDYGFREALIRLYNQYLWDFYHKSSNQTIKVGKDDWLFGRDEMFNYYQGVNSKYTNGKHVTKSELEREALRLYKVQHLLEEHGVFIFISLLPSKAFVYPEQLPRNPEPPTECFHAIEYYPHLFDSLGIHYINVEKIFEEQKGKVDYPLFPKTGMHWSHLAAQHAFDTMMRYVEHTSHKKLLHYTFGEKHVEETKYPDNDLERVMNLMRPIKPNTNYYAKVQVTPDPTATRPSYLVIGDSFFWNIAESVPLSYLFSKYQYWYYNSTVYYNEQYKNTSQVNFLDEILHTDIINLFYSPRQLYVFSNDFLPKALLYLTHEEHEIDSVVHALSERIDKGTEEERLKAAQDSLFSTPESFFPDL